MIETQNRTELSPLAEDDASMHDAGAEDIVQEPSVASIVAPGMHDAETVHADLAPYSLTREQVVERYKAAGFEVKARTVSFYAKEGRLRAVKVEAKNGLERYVFDATSVDKDIARRKSYAAPDALYVGMSNGADRVQEGSAPISHDAKSEQEADASGLHARIGHREIEVATLKTELQIEKRERANVERKLADEINRSLSLARTIGQQEARIGQLEAKLALIEGPKTEPKADAEAVPAADEEASVSEPTMQPTEAASAGDAAKRPSFLARMFRRR